MKGLWEKHYEGASMPRPYGDTTTYYRGAMWLATCHTVEDWGCGLGYFKTCMMYPERVVGIDGSWSRFADRVEDLTMYKSNVEGIFIRHVIEHNWDGWSRILDNAVASFTKRMVLVVFTPFTEVTCAVANLEFTPGFFIPDVSFKKEALTERFADYLVSEETLATKTQYGTETVFYLEKP